MNTNDAEIADRLDGMEIAGVDVRECGGYLLLHQPADNPEEFPMQIGFSPSDLLTFCRAVVERVDGKNKKLQKIFNALDNHLGDTDPDILEDATDEEICDEEPVFWAANEIAKILKENK